jgi:uncharacterized DUF497 family protein
VTFEWDSKKRLENIKKHGIDFVDVPTMFAGPMFVQLDSRQEYGEDRWIGIGILGPIVAVVVYVETGETIRIISARKASKDERKAFENKL